MHSDGLLTYEPTLRTLRGFRRPQHQPGDIHCVSWRFLRGATIYLSPTNSSLAPTHLHKHTTQLGTPCFNCISLAADPTVTLYDSSLESFEGLLQTQDQCQSRGDIGAFPSGYRQNHYPSGLPYRHRTHTSLVYMYGVRFSL